MELLDEPAPPFAMQSSALAKGTAKSLSSGKATFLLRLNQARENVSLTLLEE
jgi:hypothetical protein